MGGCKNERAAKFRVDKYFYWFARLDFLFKIQHVHRVVGAD